MRAFPGWSVVGSCHVPDGADHVTVAAVGAPVESTSGSGVARAAPVAAFQFRAAATPADSAASIGSGALPTKSMLMVSGDGLGSGTRGSSPYTGTALSWLGM